MGVINLAILAEIESGNNPTAIGDGGRARGLYQMHRQAWDDVTKQRAALHCSTRSWEDGAHSRAISSSYAVEHLQTLCSQFRRATGKFPTAPQQYALWNLGFAGFQKRGFDLSKCPKSTQRNAAKFLPTPQVSVIR